MSGIVGIFHRDGAPAAQPLLRALTQFLAYRGPDGHGTWSDGPAGFGHTMLRTTPVALASERQPASLEGCYWIVADVRLDCHAELEAELDSAERRVPSDADDAELILHAYAAWGEGCVQHLRGDFAFAIWDARRRRLFCARDHFGIKPFYYANPGEMFLFSNTLDCVRLHPSVSDELNDAAIADFLFFGLNCDVATTTFRDVQRLPAAHCLTVSSEEVRMQRYWRAPTEARIRYRRDEDYIEHFLLLLGAAVADRIRTDRAGIWLSGGMDSSTVAAMAQEVSEAGGGPELRAYTVSAEGTTPDQESQLAGQVADFLRIPMRVISLKNREPFAGWDRPESAPSEPTENPFMAGFYEEYRSISEECRVTLSGEGSDNLLFFQMWPYMRELLRKREWSRFMLEGSRFLRVRPFPWKGIRQRALRLAGRGDEAKAPRFVSPDFARRLGLDEGWKNRVRPKTPMHAAKPRAYASLSLPHWSNLFEQSDPGVTRSHLEVRYPFLDLRVANYLLAIPPFPWALQKTLLRKAMVNRLPENILRRPKTPLSSDPTMTALERSDGAAFIPAIPWNEGMDRYVDRPAVEGGRTSAHTDERIRVICLNFWLQRRLRVRYNFIAEALRG